MMGYNGMREMIEWPLPATEWDDNEADRQMILLALAELALLRPGWNVTLRRLAGRLHGEKMFDSFKEASTIAAPLAPRL
jgi:hypothetical protein